VGTQLCIHEHRGGRGESVGGMEQIEEVDLTFLQMGALAASGPLGAAEAGAIADVTHAIGVHVGLVRVGGPRAVVARVPHPVPVGVHLRGVDHVAAVVITVQYAVDIVVHRQRPLRRARWCGSEKKGDDNDKGEQLHVGRKKISAISDAVGFKLRTSGSFS